MASPNPIRNERFEFVSARLREEAKKVGVPLWQFSKSRLSRLFRKMNYPKSDVFWIRAAILMRHGVIDHALITDFEHPPNIIVKEIVPDRIYHRLGLKNPPRNKSQTEKIGQVARLFAAYGQIRRLKREHLSMDLSELEKMLIQNRKDTNRKSREDLDFVIEGLHFGRLKWPLANIPLK